jgi:NADPH:quinone reductase
VQGKYQTQPPFPWIAGLEFSGVVVESSCKDFKVGDRVFGASQGAFAEYIKVNNVTPLMKIPFNLSFEHASTLIITAPTCYHGLFDRGNIQTGTSDGRCVQRAGA